MILALVAIVISYLLGAIPFAYIVVKLFKGIDIRNYGSGNVGFTNALRVIGTGPAIIVLLADIGKGALAVLAVSPLGALQPNALTAYMPALCGGAAIIGHIWTVFLRFRGGKGVATSLGIFIGLYPLAGLISLCIWVITVAITRYVSLGSMLLCISFSVIAFATSGQYILGDVDIWTIRVLALIVSALVIYKHRGNIQRLVKGEERKFGQRETLKA